MFSGGTLYQKKSMETFFIICTLQKFQQFQNDAEFLRNVTHVLDHEKKFDTWIYLLGGLYRNYIRFKRNFRRFNTDLGTLSH